MQDKQCSPIYAFLILSEKEGDKNVLHKLQSQSEAKTGRRLRD
jgi:hypothetical protein